MPVQPTAESLLSGEFDRNVYNRLPPVWEASAELAKRGVIDEVLSGAAAIFDSEAEHNDFGIALLHRHNDVPYGSYMIESLRNCGGRAALVTSLTPERPMNLDDTAPTQWRYEDDRLIPLEFSTDRVALAGFRNAREEGAIVVEELISLIRSVHCEDILGLCIPDRSLFRRRQPNEIAVEISDREDCSNQVTLEDVSLFEPSKLIQTRWAFEDGVLSSQCVPLCSTYCYWLSPGHAVGHYDNHGIIA